MKTCVQRHAPADALNPNVNAWRPQSGTYEVEPASPPADAREWVDPCTLMLWVQDEVEALDCDHHFTAFDDTAPDPVNMLGLLTFAYSANLLASQDIVTACNSDPAFRFLCGGQVPFPEEITRFRRRHRFQLQSLLTRVLTRVLDTRFNDLNADSYTRLLQTARDQFDIARHLDEE